jgi:hypothetical protein
MESYVELIIGVLITTCIWIGVTLVTKPTSKETLESFENKVFDNNQKFEGFKYKIIGFVAGFCGVYSALFATGYLIYNDIPLFAISAAIFIFSLSILIFYWRKIIN